MHRALFFPGYPPRVEVYHPLNAADAEWIRQTAQREIGNDVRVWRRHGGWTVNGRGILARLIDRGRL